MSKSKNRLILILLCTGIVMFIAMRFYITGIHHKQQAYTADQYSPVNSDLNYILPYQNAYLGNNSNTCNLYYHLPLSDSIKDFQIFPKTLSLQVNYNTTMQQAGKENLKHTSYALPGVKDVIDDYHKQETFKALIYDSTAAFALIDNLNNIIYQFTDVTYEISRSDVMELYSCTDMKELLVEKVWQDNVQAPLKDSGYISQTASAILTTP